MATGTTPASTPALAKRRTVCVIVRVASGLVAAAVASITGALGVVDVKGALAPTRSAVGLVTTTDASCATVATPTVVALRRSTHATRRICRWSAHAAVAAVAPRSAASRPTPRGRLVTGVTEGVAPTRSSAMANGPPLAATASPMARAAHGGGSTPS